MEGDIAVAEPEASQEESDAAVRAVLSGSVAVVAFQQACKELPRTVLVYARFLDVLEPFTFPGTEKVAEVEFHSPLIETISVALSRCPTLGLSWCNELCTHCASWLVMLPNM